MNRIIMHYEGLHDGDLTEIGLQPKMCPANIWTEGYGHAMRYAGRFLKGDKDKDLAYKLSTINTIEDAEKQLSIDLEHYELLVERHIKIDLSKEQKEALTSFYYNCGVSETLTRLINNKVSSIDLLNWWTNHYITANGKYLRGLEKRRITEANLFINGKLDI